MLVPSLLLLVFSQCAAIESEEPPKDPPAMEGRLWDAQAGEGFVKHARSVEVKLSRALGTTETGSNRSHNLWVAQLQGGLMLTDVLAKESWFGGNIEGIGQLMMGGQDKPESAYLAGLNGGLRYHFRTGTRWDPFVGGSCGVIGTDIGEPDLGGKFQFNEQIGCGTRYFLSQNHALTLEYMFWHVSNAGIREPNDGVNAHVVSIGFAWVF